MGEFVQKRIKRILLIIFVLVAGIDFMSAGYFNPQYWGRSGVEELRRKSHKMFEETPETAEIGNIYKNSYKKVSLEEVRSRKESFDYVVNYLKRNYDGCEIAVKDIRNIYSSSQLMKYGGSKIANKMYMGDENIKGEDFVNSCKKMVKCVSEDMEGDEGNFSKQGETENKTYTFKTRKNCLETVSTYVQLARQDIEVLHGMKDKNLGDDIFINGTLEDSSYDLLVDVKNIRKILFKGKKEPTKSSNYEMERLDIDNAENNSEVLDTDEVDVDMDVEGPENGDENGEGDDSDNIDSEDGISGENDDGDSENDDTESSSSDENSLDEIYSQDGDDSLSSIDGESSPIDGSKCVPQENGNQSDDWREYVGSSGEEDGDVNQEQEGKQDTTDSGEDTSYSDIVTSMTPEELNDALEEGKEKMDEIKGESDLDEVKACIDGCDSTLCKVQCMCSQKAIRPERMHIKICMLPPKGKESVVKSKSVMSIEGIIDEINTVLHNLKISGKLMKHKKTDQSMETALQDVKLKNIFMFDIITARKPVFEKQDEDVQEMKKKDEWKKLERIYGIKRGSLNNEDEMNKYVQMWDSAKHEATKSFTPEVRQLNRYFSEAENSGETVNSNEVESVYQSALGVKVKKEVGRFTEHNVKFWNKTNNILYKIQSLAKNFLNKIEKGTK